MPYRRLLVFALLLLGLALAAGEDTFLHAEAGCSEGTDCSACLLRLTTLGVMPVVEAPGPAAVACGRLAVAPVRRHRDPEPRRPSSRGPPAA
jgi:hypothetical protein